MNKSVRDTEDRFNVYLTGIPEGEEEKESRGNI